MNPLSIEQIDLFHSDLRAAWLAGVPLHFSADGRPADELALERFGRRARGLAAPAGLSEAILANEDSQLPARYRAALALWAQTGDMPLVLDGLSIHRRVERAVSRSIRSTLVYLFLVLVVGYLGLVVFATFTAPRIEAMQVDLRLVPQGTPPTESGLRSALWAALATIPLVAAATVAALWRLGGTRAAAAWLGAERYRANTAAAAATRLARALIARGAGPVRSVTVACDLVGAGPKIRDQLARPLDTDQPGERAAGNRDGGVATLVTLAEQFRLIASERLATLHVVAPVVLTVVIGGAIALAYTASIFGPVVALYRDLIATGPWYGAAP